MDATQTKQGSTGDFTVANGTAASHAFTTQPPPWVAKNTNFNTIVTVYDTWGNTVPGHPITVSLDNNPGGATLTCTPASCVVPSDNVGDASFTLKLNNDSVGYTLKATGSPPAFSDAFNVADNLCTGNCNPQGTDAANNNWPRTITSHNHHRHDRQQPPGNLG